MDFKMEDKEGYFSDTRFEEFLQKQFLDNGVEWVAIKSDGIDSQEISLIVVVKLDDDYGSECLYRLNTEQILLLVEEFLVKDKIKVQKNEDGKQHIWFNPYGDKRYNIHFRYAREES